MQGDDTFITLYGSMTTTSVHAHCGILHIMVMLSKNGKFIAVSDGVWDTFLHEWCLEITNIMLVNILRVNANVIAEGK